MRRLLIGLVVAATTAIVPALALAGNQETAQQIAQSLRNSGQVTSSDKVIIRYQNGVASLSGHMAGQEQISAALMIVYQVPGVTRVVNEMTVAGSTSTREQSEPWPQSASRRQERLTQPENPLRGRENAASSRAKSITRADRVPSSFSSGLIAVTSAEESVTEPKQVTPQKARPVASASRGTEGVTVRRVSQQSVGAGSGAPLPIYAASAGTAPVRYDQPNLPNYAWPSYAPYPNYAAVTYPKQYSPTAWPYIGPFYPYPQVPMGWRKVSLEWSDGWWFLDFKDQPASCWQR